MNERVQEEGLPLEQFITALTSQLDRAQNAMAIKARLGYPLTFAVKELTLDLRTHIDMVGSVVQIRPAAPGDGEASVIHLALTTITRPMMEENTMQLAAAQPGEPTLQEALGDKLTDEEKRRLEWAGVQTVAQLVELEKHADADVVSKIANVPAMRLRAALARASQPAVSHVAPLPPRRQVDDAPSADAAPAARLRIAGRNLLRGDAHPQVSLAGRPLRVLSATATELVVEAPKDGMTGTLSVETQPGFAYSMELDESLATAFRTSNESRDASDASRSTEPGGSVDGSRRLDAGRAVDGAPSADASRSTDALRSTDANRSADASRPTDAPQPADGGQTADAPRSTETSVPPEQVHRTGSVSADGSASTDMPAPDAADVVRTNGTRRRGGADVKRAGTGDVWALAPEGYHDMPPRLDGAKGAP